MKRYKKLASQLGKTIPEPGAHIAHSAVLLLRKMRKKKKDLSDHITTTSSTKPIVKDNPFPEEFYSA